MDEIVLATDAITKSFNGFTAVEDVSLSVRRGTIHALIGPNGAGKTTCFNLLTKFPTPTSGRIYYRGKEITALSPMQIARSGMARSFQISAVFPNLTCRANVRLAVQRKRNDSFAFWRSNRILSELDDTVDALIEDVGLSEYRNDRAAQLPYGRKRALEIATTLALDPELLLLDEPMAGMAHEDIDRIAELIRKAAADRTVLMVEHNLSVVAALCDTITVLARGRVIAEGSYQKVSEDDRVIEAYLGSTNV